MLVELLLYSAPLAAAVTFMEIRHDIRYERLLRHERKIASRLITLVSEKANYPDAMPVLKHATEQIEALKDTAHNRQRIIDKLTEKVKNLEEMNEYLKTNSRNTKLNKNVKNNSNNTDRRNGTANNTIHRSADIKR